MLRGLVKNEFIKLFAKKKTYIILLLFIALSGILVAVNQVAENNYLRYNSPEYRIDSLEDNIRFQKEYIEDIKNNIHYEDEEDRARDLMYAEESLMQMETELETLKTALSEGVEYDWKKDANAQIDALKEQLKTADEVTRGYLEKDLESLEIHVKHNIPLDEQHLNKGFNYLMMNIIVVAAGFLAFGLILFNADSVSNEYNPGTLKFLLIQPVTRTKVLLSKYIVMLLSSVSLIVAVQILFCFGVGIFKGFGSLHRPILVGTQYEFVVEYGEKILREIPNSGIYIPLSQYLLKALILQIVFIIVMVTFIFMVSTLSKSSVFSMTITIGSLLGTNIVYALSNTYRKLSAYIFFHFGNIESILSGTIVRETKNLQFTFTNIIIVSIISSIVLLLIAIGVFKKRDIQI